MLIIIMTFLDHHVAFRLQVGQLLN